MWFKNKNKFLNNILFFFLLYTKCVYTAAPILVKSIKIIINIWTKIINAVNYIYLTVCVSTGDKNFITII